MEGRNTVDEHNRMAGRNTPEELPSEALSELVIDMLHRIAVHHTLWFREVEHLLGFDRAIEVMDEAWEKTRSIAGKRLIEEFSRDGSSEARHNHNIGGAAGHSIDREAGPDSAGEPAIPLNGMDRAGKLSILEMLAKDWLAMDGVWFQAVEKRYGMNDAKRCNDSTWARFSPFEAHSVKKLLGLEEHPGLEGLERALNFRLYGRLNRQSSFYDEEGALVFRMNVCRVQAARQRKHLPDYPCKSAGLVEYTSFARSIDDRIVTECICCPPDAHPEDCACAWRFILRKDRLG